MDVFGSLPSSPKKPTRTILVAIIVVVIVILGVGIAWYRLRQGKTALPAPNLGTLSLSGNRVTPVQLKEEYQNPFDRTNQFVNPFQEFKSPFTSLQK